MVEEKHLDPLKRRKPKQPHYMDKQHRGDSHLMREWNLIVPDFIANLGWEEPR